MIHDNSRKSFDEEKEKGRSECFRKAVYICYSLSSIPLTDRQVMDYLNEKEVNNIRPEITRLKQDGLIRECGKTICAITNKTVRVCEITSEPYFSKGNRTRQREAQVVLV